MHILIKKAHIQDPASPFHQTRKDILIIDGIINAIDDHIEAADAETVDVPDLVVSPGWVDLFAHFCDPGYEHKESLETGAAAAAAGGPAPAWCTLAARRRRTSIFLGFDARRR
jgi:dihydroorotase